MSKVFTKDKFNKMKAFIKDDYIDNEVKTFLKDNNHLETFLVGFYDEQVKTAIDLLVKCKEDFEGFEKQLIDCFDGLCDVSTFKGPVPDHFKYKLETLTANDLKDYQLLKHSLSLTKEQKISRVYRVVPTSAAATNSEEAQELLLHGTKAKNVMGILKVGFKPSEARGLNGHGIYLTDDCRKAMGYGRCLAKERETPKKLKC